MRLAADCNDRDVSLGTVTQTMVATGALEDSGLHQRRNTAVTRQLAASFSTRLLIEKKANWRANRYVQPGSGIRCRFLQACVRTVRGRRKRGRGQDKDWRCLFRDAVFREVLELFASSTGDAALAWRSQLLTFLRMAVKIFKGLWVP